MLDTKTDTCRFYAACLAAYNNGFLHGAWIEATSDAEEMQEAVNAMLAASPIPDAEEWQIHDYDDQDLYITRLGKTSDLNAVAEIIEAVDEIEADYDSHIVPLLVNWAADKVCEVACWKSAIDDAFGGVWSDPEDYAADYCESTGHVDGVPEAIRGYIDFKAMARDLALGGDVDFICVHSGNYLQDYDSMRGRECIALYNH